MNIVVNGKKLSCEVGLTVQDLLVQMNVAPEAIIVEHNARFVQRSEFRTTTLSEADAVELIQFVGGG
jgi:sulfur carrier protein